jgi:hypothetical protein
MDVFDVFDLTEYTFLQLSRGGIEGNTIVGSYQTDGVFKLRNAIVRNDNSETKDSNATLHIRPTESFLSGLDGNLVGHGVQVDGKDYEIIGQTGGKNFDNGVMEHYTATLQETDFSDLGGSSGS